MPFIVFHGIECFFGFHEENSVKANLKVQDLMNTAEESELPSQAVIVFCLVIKETFGIRLS